LFTGLGFRNDEDVDRPVSLPGSADNADPEGPNDELWGDDDDDFELTQKDLENIDCEVMASQSAKNSTTTHHPSVGASNPGPLKKENRGLLAISHIYTSCDSYINL
jgi:hypothetical protein